MEVTLLCLLFTEGDFYRMWYIQAVFVCLFEIGVSMYSPCQPGILYVTQAILDLTEIFLPLHWSAKVKGVCLCALLNLKRIWKKKSSNKRQCGGFNALNPSTGEVKEGDEEFRILLVLSIHFEAISSYITLSPTKIVSISSTYFSNTQQSHLCVFSVYWMEASLCCGSVLGKAGKAYQVKMLVLFEDPYILETNYTHLNDAMHTCTHETGISVDQLLQYAKDLKIIQNNLYYILVFVVGIFACFGDLIQNSFVFLDNRYTFCSFGYRRLTTHNLYLHLNLSLLLYLLFL